VRLIRELLVATQLLVRIRRRRRARFRLGIEGLYIDCFARTAPVYEKNGWAIIEREVGDKESVVMLRTITRERQSSRSHPFHGDG
jgi:hypothetical protein